MGGDAALFGWKPFGKERNRPLLQHIRRILPHLIGKDIENGRSELRIEQGKQIVPAAILREKREQKKITQRELAERLNMCTRTVIEIEKCKSNPRFETVALISEEMDISLDGIVFHDRAPQTVAKCVTDFFAGKSADESQKYIDLCMSADKLK